MSTPSQHPRDATRAVVDTVLRRLAASPDAAAELYGDEVDWRLSWPSTPRASAIPWIRERRTRRDVADHYRVIAAEHLPEHAVVDVERVLVDGADAVVLGTVTNTVRKTGRTYRARFALHLTVRDGKIVRHHVYEDSLAVADAWHADPG
ncbi:nuclear transport factor 2 family protein [Kineococcus glutinatus]|uniref:nuclear transport factor 2 family protein n=1 Tax=Kineococcus glutinatus TaxID=1070872 RepID=UPI0031E76E28